MEAAEIKHKQAEAALRESEERYRHLYEYSPIGIGLASVDGKVISCNKAMENITGYSVEELKKINLVDIYKNPEERKALIEIVTRLGGVANFPAVLKRKNGTPYNVLLTLSRFRNLGGEDLFQTICIDVTEYKRAEEALREQTIRNELILQTAMDGFFILDMEGNILKANHAASLIIGYSLEELVDMNIRDLESLETPQETTEHIERLMKEGPDRFETKHRRKDGQIMDVEICVNFAETAEERFIFCFFRDITERKQAEAALRESEEKFRTLAEQSPNMIFINKKGRVVYANSRCEEVMGYTRHEFYAPDFDFLRLIAPESIEIVKSSYATHVQGGEVEPYEHTLITKKGERIEGIINTRLINYEGEPAILGIVTDITEYKRAEEALRESEEKYRTLVECSLQGLNIIQGFPPRIIFANSSMAEIYGYTVDEFLSVLPEETGALVHPEDRELVWGRYRDRLSGKKVPPRYEFRVIRKDGTFRWVEVFSSRIEYRGEPAVQAVLADITERKRAEEALREQTIRNELILQTAMDGFFILDVEGRILKANYGASVISGYSQEELVGMNCRDLEALETPRETTEHIERLMKEGSDRFETKHRRKDGQIIDVEVGVNFAETAEERFIFCFFHDVTERKRAEKALLEREKELEIKTSNLEEVNTALRVLLKRREQDKTEFEEKVLFNTKELVVPYVEKLKKSGLDERQMACVGILESNLNDIVSPFSRSLSSLYLRFTPAEMQVANLVRHAKTTKEIAEFLNVSTQTIDSHRKSIRRKMGLRNKKANLRTHLLSMKE